jgi:signal transduction histidine kinase
VVVDDEGISIIDTAREADRNFLTRPEIEVALSGRHSTGTRRSNTLQTDLLFVAVPVASGGTVHGALRITLGTEEVTERIWKFWFGLVAVAVVILTVMAGVGWVIARSITRPIRRLQATATRFSGGDLTPTDPDINTTPELAALESAMNNMAHRLDELIERQRSFVADASHQLRTPLTALRLRLENLQSESEANASTQISDAIDETTRLSVLVDDLLLLARSEKPSTPAVIDLTQLVRDRVDVWTATAELEDVSLELVTEARTIEALAVPGGIEQVLDNLLDNAIRAAPPASAVTVTLKAGELQHTVKIADRGPGMSDNDKAQALQRFWRSDDSVPGTGLGLAIADSIVRVSGGTIILSDNSSSGLVATIAMPNTNAPRN